MNKDEKRLYFWFTVTCTTAFWMLVFLIVSAFKSLPPPNQANPQDQVIRDLRLKVAVLEVQQDETSRRTIREMDRLQLQLNHQNRMLLSLAMKRGDQE